MTLLLDHVVIHVSDWGASNSFYRDVLGGGADLCFAWDGPIESAVEHLGERGVEVEVGPVTRYGGRGRGTSVYFRDPDGGLLELISYA